MEQEGRFATAKRATEPLYDAVKPVTRHSSQGAVVWSCLMSTFENISDWLTKLMSPLSTTGKRSSDEISGPTNIWGLEYIPEIPELSMKNYSHRDVHLRTLVSLYSLFSILFLVSHSDSESLSRSPRSF